MNINSIKSIPSFGARLEDTYASEQLRVHFFDLGLSREDWQGFVEEIKSMPQKVVTFDEFVRDEMFGRSFIMGNVKDGEKTIPLFVKVHDTLKIAEDLVGDLRLNLAEAGKIAKKVIK